MMIWKLTPVAREDDPHWKSFRYKRSLLVQAHDPAGARLKATDWYRKRFYGDDCADNTGQFCRSAFEDEKLYQAVRLATDSIHREELKYPVVK